VLQLLNQLLYLVLLLLYPVLLLLNQLLNLVLQLLNQLLPILVITIATMIQIPPTYLDGVNGSLLLLLMHQPNVRVTALVWVSAITVFKRTPNGITVSVTLNQQANKLVGFPLEQTAVNVLDKLELEPLPISKHKMSTFNIGSYVDF